MWPNENPREVTNQFACLADYNQNEPSSDLKHDHIYEINHKHEDSYKNEISSSKLTSNKIYKKCGVNLSYGERIDAIEQFFGVSNICAIYLYHRRRRGVPWKTQGDPKYLEWNMQMQNSIIFLDTIIGFDWLSLEFGFEEIQFVKNNIYISKMSTKPIVIGSRNENQVRTEDSDGFTKVSNSKKDITKELNKMGLLPKKYIVGLGKNN